MVRNGRDSASRPKTAHVLFFLHLAVFLILVIGEGSSWYAPTLLVLGVSDGAGLIANPWCVVSYVFLNIHPLEFVVGTGILLLAGVPLEDRLGRHRFLLIYFLATALIGLAHIGMIEAGVISNPLFTGSVGASAGLLTAYLFVFGHERQVGSVPFPIFYLIAASSLFAVLVLVDYYNQEEFKQQAQILSDQAYRGEDRTTDQRIDDLLAVGALEGQQRNSLGHMLGLVLGGLSLAFSQLQLRVHERFRVMREIHGLQQEVDARARVELLLEKISRDGMESLSRNERKFLRYASRFYQARVRSKSPS